MTRPLIVTDCDEVLLHMVRHFRDWLGRAHDVEMKLEGNSFANSMRKRGSDETMSEEEMWDLLGGFFDDEMSSQTAVPGAIEAMQDLQREADVVVLTNLGDARNEARRQQLLSHGLDLRIFTNQGPKGGALKAIVEEFAPSTAVFIDDIGAHHKSASEFTPNVRRLHFCGEPSIAPLINCAHQGGFADARIDSWDEALPWVLSQIEGQ